MSITERANRLIENIQEKMNIVEMADMMIDALSHGELIISGQDEDGCEVLTSFDETLTQNQKEEAKRVMLCMLEENKRMAADYLEMLTAEPKAEEPAEEPKKKGGRPRKTA